MSKHVVMVAVAVLWGLLSASPVSAERASVIRLENVRSALTVALPDDYPLRSFSRIECSFLVRVERPDGSAVETQVCALSDEPVMVPEFQGVAPDRAFRLSGGPCMWTSDFWWTTADVPVYSDSFSYVVTPSGMVRVTSTYPAVPLVCG